MAEMASYQRHIGPWPIKRSQSVPDASMSIFTPRNSPLSLERLLAKVDEDCASIHYTVAQDPKITHNIDWSAYSMAQPSIDPEKEGDDKSKQKPKKDRRAITINLIVHGTALLLGTFYLLVPFAITETSRGQTSYRITVPGEGRSTIWPYCLTCLLTTMIGVMISIVSCSMGVAMEKRAFRSQDLFTILLSAIIWIMIMTLGWIFLVLPPLV